jgi:hypothetical protein
VLAGLVLIAAWMFRTSSAPLWTKVVVPTVCLCAAVFAPLQVGAMMGFPVAATMAALPDEVELIAFAPHDDSNLVDLWLIAAAPTQAAGVPRAYEAPLNPSLKETLREARERISHGQRVILTKRRQGRGGPRAEFNSGNRNVHGGHDALDIGGGDQGYTIDEHFFHLPNKE